MASRYRWRQQLLGSLQGQLQLATYLVVFLGFTGASSVAMAMTNWRVGQAKIATCPAMATTPALAVMDLMLCFSMEIRLITQASLHARARHAA